MRIKVEECEKKEIVELIYLADFRTDDLRVSSNMQIFNSEIMVDTTIV